MPDSDRPEDPDDKTETDHDRAEDPTTDDGTPRGDRGLSATRSLLRDCGRAAPRAKSVDSKQTVTKCGAETPIQAGCGWCGTEIDQPEVGRRRQFCSDRCRRAAGRRRQNSAATDAMVAQWPALVERFDSGPEEGR